MKRSVLLAATACAALSLIQIPASAAPATAAPGQRAADAKGLATAVIQIKGMDCEGCAKGITNRINRVVGVKSVDVNFKKSGATVKYDPATCKPADLLAAVKKAGYTGSLKR